MFRSYKNKVKIETLSITEKLLFLAVRVIPLSDRELLGSVGTGFHYVINDPDSSSGLMIVTNKHVVESATGAIIHTHVTDGEGYIVGSQEVVVQYEDGLVMHPDPDVDLCAIPFAGVYEGFRSTPNPLYYNPLGREHRPIEWSTFDASESVVMVGCPSGLLDSHNRLPILRRGYTASHPAFDYDGRPEFMVDMACFPGSSGSPVFQLATFGQFNRETQTYPIVGNFSFLGVLRAGPLVNNAGEIRFGAPTKIDVKTMMHLGLVIKSTEMDGLEDEARRIMANQRHRT